MSDILGGMLGPRSIDGNENTMTARPGGTSTPQNVTYVVQTQRSAPTLQDQAAYLEEWNRKLAGSRYQEAGLIRDGKISRVAVTVLFQRLMQIEPQLHLLETFHPLADRLLNLLEQKW